MDIDISLALEYNRSVEPSSNDAKKRRSNKKDIDSSRPCGRDDKVG
ncbi:MAG: hypothetical protein F6K55_25330 [Moorea sp. SIO4A3]|nr:hypothetical protein [Moorena sp. SIO4A3]